MPLSFPSTNTTIRLSQNTLHCSIKLSVLDNITARLRYRKHALLLLLHSVSAHSVDDRDRRVLLVDVHVTPPLVVNGDMAEGHRGVVAHLLLSDNATAIDFDVVQVPVLASHDQHTPLANHDVLPKMAMNGFNGTSTARPETNMGSLLDHDVALAFSLAAGTVVHRHDLLSEQLLNIRLSTSRRFFESGPRLQRRRSHIVVLHGRPRHEARKRHDETIAIHGNGLAGLEKKLRVVLHQRFKTRGLQILRFRAGLQIIPSVDNDLVFRIHEFRHDSVRILSHVPVLLNLNAQTIAIAGESARHLLPPTSQRIPVLSLDIPAGIDRVPDHVLQLVVLHVAHHLIAVGVLEGTQTARLRLREMAGNHLLVRTTLHARAHHMCMSSHGECRHTGHGHEVHGVRVLEEEHVAKIVPLQPLLDDAVLLLSERRRKVRGRDRNAHHHVHVAS